MDHFITVKENIAKNPQGRYTVVENKGLWNSKKAEFDANEEIFPAPEVGDFDNTNMTGFWNCHRIINSMDFMVIIFRMAGSACVLFMESIGNRLSL